MLEIIVFVNGLGVQEKSSSLVLPIVPNRIEVGFAICEEWYVDFAGAYLFVPADGFDLFAVIAEGNVLAHEVYLAEDGEEMLEGDIKLSSDSYGYHLLLLVDLVLQLYPLLLLVELPLPLVELSVVVNHGCILHTHFVDHRLLAAPNLCFPNLLHILHAKLVCHV